MKTIQKTARIFIASILVLLLVVASVSELIACEACNRLFLGQLHGPDRAASLVSRELLATIAAVVSNTPSPGAATVAAF